MDRSEPTLAECKAADRAEREVTWSGLTEREQYVLTIWNERGIKS